MSESKSAKIDRVRFLFNIPDDYKLICVNGVYGGITPRGELICHFFFEYPDIPAEEVAPLIDGKIQPDKVSKIERIKHKPNERVIRRDVRVGLIIPVQHINSIANWMLDKLKTSQIIVEEKEVEE